MGRWRGGGGGGALFTLLASLGQQLVDSSVILPKCD